MLVKKRITYLSYALVFLAQLVLAVAVIVTPAQAQSPLGYWTFNDGSGTRAADASGYGHTATLVNGVSWVTGQAGGAVAADAASQQYVSIPAIDLSSTQAVTIALWVNRTYSTAGGHVLFEASTNDDSRSTPDFALLPDDACHGIQIALHGDAGYTSNCYSQPSSGAWHHLAVVFDKRQTAGDAVKFYLDGVFQIPSQSLFAATNTDTFGNDPIYLFSDRGERMFDSGALDDVLIYNTALTAAQIQQIYHGTTLLALAITPAKASIPAGTQQQFTATGTYGDGSQQDLTSLVTWNTATSSVATIDSGGLATAVTPGSTILQATSGSISSSVGVTVLTPAAGLTDSAAPATRGQGFDFRNTQGFAIDPPGSTYVLSSTIYPTTVNGVTFGWVNSYLVGARELSATVDPRLAGINFARNRQPATFYVDLPAPGTYDLTLAMGNADSPVCWQACQVQFWDGNTVLATVRESSIAAGHFYDAVGNDWSAAQWPTSNVARQVTLTGTRLAVVLGTNQASDDFTPLSYLGINQPARWRTFTISASPSSLSVAQGNQGTSTITTTIGNGFNSAITLSASGMPSGTTVSFNPNPIPAPGSGNSTMTITVGSSTPTGTYPITVTGNGGGVQQHTTVTLTVTAPPSFAISASPSSLSVAQGNQGTSTITTTISNGFNSAITLSASGMPSGTTVSFNPNPIPAPGSGSSTMTITVGSSTPTGTYPITITGNGGGVQQNTTVTLTVTAPPTFSISASPSTLSVVQGNQGTSTITTTISNGFNSAITLSASGMPSGTTVSFNPNPIPAPGSGNSTMTITVGSSTPTGTYPITVTGNGGGVQQHTTVTLTVTAPPTFTISASPSSLSVAQGNQGTSTITTTISNGFNSAITLSASGMPSGTTVSFNPNLIPAPGSGSSTMTITVGSSTPTGTYPITITGNGGGVQQNTTVTLMVVAYTTIALDGTVHGVQDNGPSSSNTAALKIGTPTAGDLITCQITFDSGDGNTLVSVTDNNNGAYAAAVPVHLNTTLNQWLGIYYKENVAASPTTVTLTTSQSRPWSAISCQGWQGAATSNSLDLSFVQLQDAVDTPNPTTGSNKTPAASGELVVAAVVFGNSGTPTAGVNYTLIDGAATTYCWPEYWIQTTAAATAGNYTWPSDTWTDMMAAFQPDPAAGNFAISASPSSLNVAQGNQGTSTITTTISNGFNSAITLSASGMPSGTTVSFNPNPIPAPGSGNSTMIITVGSSTPTGTYPITVTAAPTFAISASPSSLNVVQGNQGTSTITTTISNGFNSAITLSASGMPSGTTVSFNPNPIPAPGSGNSTMIITVGSSTPTGTYPITVTGNGGGIQQNTTVTLTVTALVALSWTASTSPGVIGYNAYRSTTSGGPYTKVNASLISTTNYTDQPLQSGSTYYYVTTAVNSQGQESAYSNEAVATIP